MAIVLPIDTGLIFNGNRVTDHNREPIQISSTRIENRKRMADGTLRTFVVAKKNQFKVSWTNVPRQDAKTADGYWGAISMYDFYQETNGEFVMTLTKGDHTTENYTVLFNDFSLKLNTRSSWTDLYDVDITMDEA